MQLIQNEPPRTPTLPVSQEPAPSAARTAAKWVGIGLDPRNGAKFLGRTGAVLTALALPRVTNATTSSCYDYRNFQSPNSHDEYAVQDSCGYAHRDLQRFIDKCGAVPSNGGYPAFWHVVKYWGSPELLRQHSSQAANDSAFVACLIHEGNQLYKHDWKIAGIVIGSVLGAGLLGLGAWCAISACCGRRGGAVDAVAPQRNATELSNRNPEAATLPTGSAPPAGSAPMASAGPTVEFAAKFEKLPL